MCHLHSIPFPMLTWYSDHVNASVCMRKSECSKSLSKNIRLIITCYPFGEKIAKYVNHGVYALTSKNSSCDWS